jgi:hypothetical protein
LGAGIALATAAAAGSAHAAPPRRVVVAGPNDDAIAARVQKELTALGFETIRVGGLDGCARNAVVVAAQDTSAIAAACSDGDQVGVWVSEDGTLRLRDVVVVREEGESGRETTAVRAAEVTRATIAMRDAEEETRTSSPPSPPMPMPTPSPAPTGSEMVDRPPPRPAAPSPRSVQRAPAFLAGAGFSSLLGVDASVAAFSGQAEVGILRHLTATARLEYPIETSEIGRGSRMQVAPAFAGAGIGIPLRAPDAFVIPRVGAGAGVAWINATRPSGQSVDGTGSFLVTTAESRDSTASFAGYASIGLSMRIYRPLRLTADGIFGSTTSRLVVRDRLVHVAYWGTPFGALALRLELMFK